MFYGRHQELQQLKDSFRQPKGTLVAVYGRRRIGKSTLLKHFARDKQMLFFEGLEKQHTKVQIQHFSRNLKAQLKDQRLLQKAAFSTWSDVFDFLTSHLTTIKPNKKMIIIFDEFQWMAAGQSKLVALLKFYWDNHWKDLNVMLVLCGSIASFMVKKVIHSKALYGRVSLSLCIDKLLPQDARQMLSRRSEAETLKYLMIMGGVPKYLEAIDQSKSFEQNIENLFFKNNSQFAGEFEKIFYSHFKEPSFYLRIIRALLDGAKSLSELSVILKTPSGGGMSSYLENLSLAGFVRVETPFLSMPNSKIRKYRVSDEYMMFFSKFLQKNQKIIAEGGGLALFRNKILKTWNPWLGLSFESFCTSNALVIADAMGFREKVLSYGPAFARGKDGYQIDLLFERSDHVITLCELKYHNQPVETDVIPQVLKKAQLFKTPKGHSLEYGLISPMGATKSLVASRFFHHIIDEKDLFNHY
jgi:AAA+ ATPase superfamily predicted ATPase